MSSSFPFDLWARLLARTWRRPAPQLPVGGDAGGHPDLRAAIAHYVGEARGIACDPDHVLVVSGIRQALDLTCRLLLDPGDAAWMENPGHPGLRAVLVANGLQVASVPVDGEGIDVAAGRRMAPRARLACVAPSHQYPLGVALSLQRRLMLLDWAREAEAWVLEDDYDSEYRYAGRPLAALKSLDADHRVIYVGTLSKLMFPSLRLAYLVAPPQLADAFRRLRAALDDQPSMVAQPALAELFRSGHLAAHVRRMRQTYAARQRAFLAAAESASRWPGRVQARGQRPAPGRPSARPPQGPSRSRACGPGAARWDRAFLPVRIRCGRRRAGGPDVRLRRGAGASGGAGLAAPGGDMDAMMTMRRVILGLTLALAASAAAGERRQRRAAELARGAGGGR